jgi:hypothetical protein
VLRHFLNSGADALVSDVILAKVRGMIADCAAQLLAVAAGRDPAMRGAGAEQPAALDSLAGQLTDNEALLAHCHALAAESLIAERLQQRLALDPVLSPLLQELIASEDPEIASLAMSALAAQSRFVQSQRRMELPLGELPPELFHALFAQGLPSGRDSDTMARVQSGYDEASTRLGLFVRLVAAMRRGAVAALAIEHAGLALFVSTLATVARVPRQTAVLGCHEGQSARLALLLRSAGLSTTETERQLLLIAPAAHLPRGLADLSAERADALARHSGDPR